MAEAGGCRSTSTVCSGGRAKSAARACGPETASRRGKATATHRLRVHRVGGGVCNAMTFLVSARNIAVPTHETEHVWTSMNVSMPFIDVHFVRAHIGVAG